MSTYLSQNIQNISFSWIIKSESYIITHNSIFVVPERVYLPILPLIKWKLCVSNLAHGGSDVQNSKTSIKNEYYKNTFIGKHPWLLFLY